MKIHLNSIFLMSVLLLGLVSYPSAQINSENNVDENNSFPISFANMAYGDENDEDENDDKDKHERDDEGKHDEERDDKDEHDDKRDSKNEYKKNEVEDEHEEEHNEKSEKDEFEIKGIVELVNLITQSFTLDNGKVIFVDENTKFDDFDSLGDLKGFAVEVEVVTSNSSLIATEIEKEHEDEKDDDNDEADDLDDNEESEEIEIEVEIENGNAKVKVEFGGRETKFIEDFVDEESLAETILSHMPDLSLDASEVMDIWDLKIEEKKDKSLKTTHEHKEESVQTALDLINELQQKIDQLENRIQTLLEKYQSGEYFGTVPKIDSEIRSYVISFEGLATSMDDEFMVDVEGQIHIENLLTVDDSISKFRVNGGEISVDDKIYDIAFGKARVSSTGSSGEKDMIVLLGQVIDFANPNDDSTTIKLVIDSETPLEGDFGLDPINIEILSQSKIAGKWYLNGSGELSLLEG